MARRQRLEYSDAIYHVIQRGNNKEYIFDTSEDKEYLIECLQRAVDVDGVEIFAYVVMSNHYHIALRSEQESLSKVMHRINTRYSVWYNRKRERSTGFGA
ncbi:MAG: transposase [Bacillota bacterium]|nr:transposase [Bacillota bacterium]